MSDILGFGDEQEVKGGVQEFGDIVPLVVREPVNVNVSDPPGRPCVKR